MVKAQSEFTVKTWNQTNLQGERSDVPMMRVSAVFESAGAIAGEFLVEYVMHYQRRDGDHPDAGEARYAGILLFTGDMDGKSGSFALEDSGIYADGDPSSKLTIIGYSGTGDFAGINGKGKYYAENGTMRLELDYSIGA